MSWSGTHRNLLFFVLALALSRLAWADETLQTTISLQSDIEQAAAQSQTRIDETYAQTRRLADEYKANVRELESLRRYNHHLEKMVAGQQRSIGTIETDLDEIDVTRREIVPLLSRMVEALTRFVELDVPFLNNERRERVAGLQALMNSSQNSIGEKYRQILEAYQIEADFGRTMQAYRGKLDLRGTESTVDFLRVGRIAWIYRSLDGGDAGVWDRQTKSWRALPDGFRRSLDKALRVARKESPPELVKVPVPAPERLP